MTDLGDRQEEQKRKMTSDFHLFSILWFGLGSGKVKGKQLLKREKGR